MPTRVFCKKCGTLIFEHPEIVSAQEVYDHFEGKCSKCGARLNRPDKMDVSVKKV